MTCGREGCDRAALTRGLCRKHYMAERSVRLEASRCTAPDCERPVFCKLLCRGHYVRSRRGVPITTPVRDSRRGNAILSMRIDAHALERFREHARAAGLSVNKWAAAQLLRLLESAS